MGQGRQTSLLDLLAMLQRLLGREVQPRFAPPRPGDVRESMADISHARRVLGFEPQVDLADGLAATIEYYREIAALAAGSPED